MNQYIIESKIFVSSNPEALVQSANAYCNARPAKFSEITKVNESTYTIEVYILSIPAQEYIPYYPPYYTSPNPWYPKNPTWTSAGQTNEMNLPENLKNNTAKGNNF